MKETKPKISCFVCKWAGHDEELTSMSKRKAFSNVDVVTVPCLGRVDPTTVLESMLKGVDGVILLGCAIPDCHFIKGNVYANITMNVLKKLLRLTALEHDRLEIRLISAIEDKKLANIVGQFARRLKKFGPSPLSEDKKDSTVFREVLAAKNAVADFRLRAVIGKEKQLTSDSNTYGETVAQEDYEAFTDGVIQTEFIRHKMLLSIKEKPTSVKELAEDLGLKPALVFRHILNMRRQGVVTMDHVEGTTPIYKALEAQ